MRYIIIFLVGFFLGGFFKGNLIELGVKAKEMVLQDRSERQPVAEDEFIVTTSQSEREPRRETVVTRRQPVEPVPERQYKAVSKPQPTRQKVYTVQVASFKQVKQAKKLVDQLTNQEYNAYIAPKKADRPDDLYRVCVGESASLDQAKSMNRKLKSRFKDSFVYSF